MKSTVTVAAVFGLSVCAAVGAGGCRGEQAPNDSGAVPSEQDSQGFSSTFPASSQLQSLGGADAERLCGELAGHFTQQINAASDQQMVSDGCLTSSIMFASQLSSGQADGCTAAYQECVAQSSTPAALAPEDVCDGSSFVECSATLRELVGCVDDYLAAMQQFSVAVGDVLHSALQGASCDDPASWDVLARFAPPEAPSTPSSCVSFAAKCPSFSDL